MRLNQAFIDRLKVYHVRPSSIKPIKTLDSAFFVTEVSIHFVDFSITFLRIMCVDGLYHR